MPGVQSYQLTSAIGGGYVVVVHNYDMAGHPVSYTLDLTHVPAGTAGPALTLVSSSTGAPAMPAAVAATPATAAVATLLYAVANVPVAFAFVVGLQRYRYRCRYGAVQRQQTKRVFLGMALQALVLLTLMVWLRAVPALQPHSAANAMAGEAWLCAKVFGPLGSPLPSCAIAWGKSTTSSTTHSYIRR